ncbi:hypothetical protein ACWGQT_00350 [Streptomyces yangpuensis]
MPQTLSTRRFNIYKPGKPRLTDVQLAHATVHQQIAYDHVNGWRFVSQMMHGGVQLPDESAPVSLADRAKRGDIVINRLAMDGTLSGSMIARGMGHGHFGVEPVGNDAYIWSEANATLGSGNTFSVGKKIGRFKWVNGAVINSGAVGMEMFNPLPTMWALQPVLDLPTRRISIHYMDPADGYRAWFDTYDMDEMKQLRNTRLSRTPRNTSESGALPSVWQTHALYGQYHYVMTGNSYDATTNPPPGNCHILAIRIPDGKWVDLAANGTALELPYREPEGMTVNYGGSQPTLEFGFATRTSSPRLVTTFSWDLLDEPAPSVLGQASAGPIDAMLRDNPGDGTLGRPDYSPVPYVYAPLMGSASSEASWVIDQYRTGNYAGFKGSRDGLGAVRFVGRDNASFAVDLATTAQGTKTTGSPGIRNPILTWGPRDFVLALRHPGSSTWFASSTRAYLAFTGDQKTLGMRLTTPVAEGPWDAETADAATLPLGVGGAPDVWDGAVHNIIAACFGSNVIALIDGKYCATFRAPRAYRRFDFTGNPDPTMYADLPTSGPFGGFDSRNERTYLYGWTALQAASGDLFSYDMTPTQVQTPPVATYTPSVLPSGESWALTGTATASKDGLLLAASSTATFTVQAPHGYISTRWGACQAQAGLVFRRQDASNYHIVTSTAVIRYTAGTPTTIATLEAPLANGAQVVLHNFPGFYRLFVNGVQKATGALSQGATATGLGFLNPAGGTSQWRYIVHQPYPNDPILPV